MTHVHNQRPLSRKAQPVLRLADRRRDDELRDAYRDGGTVVFLLRRRKAGDIRGPSVRLLGEVRLLPVGAVAVRGGEAVEAFQRERVVAGFLPGVPDDGVHALARALHGGVLAGGADGGAEGGVDEAGVGVVERAAGAPAAGAGIGGGARDDLV